MDLRRQPANVAIFSDEPLKTKKKDSQSLPYFTNAVFFTTFFSVSYFLLLRWRQKIRTSTPLHFLTISEVAAIFCLIVSVIYLTAFFGIAFVLHPFAASTAVNYDDEDQPDVIAKNACNFLAHCSAPSSNLPPLPPNIADRKPLPESLTLNMEDKDVVQAVVSGSIPSYSLESKLGDCRRAAAIRHEAVQSATGKSLEGLPVEGFNYDSIIRELLFGQESSGSELD